MVTVFDAKTRQAWEGPKKEEVPLDLPIEYMDERELVEPDYLIKGLFYKEQMSQVWGPPKTGKTFLVLHLLTMISIADGERRTFGRRIRPGKVLYIAAEAGRTIHARLRLIKRKLRIVGTNTNFGVITKQVNFFNDERLEDYISEIAKGFDLICIDTLARATGGMNENDPVDMGALVAKLDRVRMRLGCHIMVVHHSTKAGGNSSRGHSSLEGAIDVSVRVTSTKPDDLYWNERKAETLLNKDGELGCPMVFDIESGLIQMDSDEEPWTSCTIREKDANEIIAERKKVNPAKLKKNERLLWNSFNDLRATKPIPIPKGPYYPTANVNGVIEADLLKLFKDRKAEERSFTKNTIKTAFDNSLELLIDIKYFGKYEGYIWAVSDVDQAEGELGPHPNNPNSGVTT